MKNKFILAILNVCKYMSLILTIYCFIFLTYSLVSKLFDLCLQEYWPITDFAILLLLHLILVFTFCPIGLILTFKFDRLLCKIRKNKNP